MPELPDFGWVSYRTETGLQLPGRDTLLRQAVFGGAGRDAVLYLEGVQLDRLLEASRTSMVGRVVLPQPGVRVQVYTSPAGRHYEVWQLVSAPPRPEATTLDTWVKR